MLRFMESTRTCVPERPLLLIRLTERNDANVEPATTRQVPLPGISFDLSRILRYCTSPFFVSVLQEDNECTMLKKMGLLKIVLGLLGVVEIVLAFLYADTGFQSVVRNTGCNIWKDATLRQGAVHQPPLKSCRGCVDSVK